MKPAAWACVIALASPSIACDRPATSDVLSDAITTAQPFASKFAAYETWALRATSVSQPSASNAALTEALFAPIRNDQAVLAAWITLPRNDADELSFPPRVLKPSPEAWTQVRDPALGWIRVTRHQHCPLTLPKGWRSGTERCVMLTRDPEHQPPHTLTITLAFVDSSD